jgi:hypothetical protein
MGSGLLFATSDSFFKQRYIYGKYNLWEEEKYDFYPTVNRKTRC